MRGDRSRLSQDFRAFYAIQARVSYAARACLLSHRVFHLDRRKSRDLLWRVAIPKSSRAVEHRVIRQNFQLGFARHHQLHHRRSF